MSPSSLTAQILEQKRHRRQLLAQLPFPEKVRIVEKLRDAAKRISASAELQGLRGQSATNKLANPGSGPKPS